MNRNETAMLDISANDPCYPEISIMEISNLDLDAAVRLDTALLLLAWMLGGGRPPLGEGTEPQRKIAAFNVCAAAIRLIAQEGIRS